MNIEIITAPLIGGMIGLITNSLAIKMLFRPYKEIRIMKVRIPFTPGLIPKEKPRIARAIAQVISNYILDNDTILSALASDTIREAYEQKYDKKLLEWKGLDLSCRELLEKYNLTELADAAEIKARDSIGRYLVEQCQKEEIARKLVENVFAQFRTNMNPLVYKVGKKAMEAAQRSMIQQADEMLVSKGPEVIGQYIDQSYAGWMNKDVSEIVVLLEQKVPDLKQILWEKYTELLTEKSGSFLSALNIQGIIENKINEYDLEELEKMIMEISKKELNALVWLGGLLGVIMGFVNLVF